MNFSLNQFLLAVSSALDFVEIDILAAWFGWARRLGRAGFYLLFAFAVTASVQLVGVYLVFASLIIPALAVRPCLSAANSPLPAGCSRLRAGTGAIRVVRPAVRRGDWVDTGGNGGARACIPFALRIELIDQLAGWNSGKTES